ncbi:hypothetical protein DVS28_a3920 [Euzebya pacifica]|uniref:Uncharacterized protein n=1 Tax=Euzebya pacifica TaxID=1608957 RepID=A0A346Y295_9ACTN|nr:hypothetical protein DVS28_a3920 [Euzebya pacifica]
MHGQDQSDGGGGIVAEAVAQPPVHLCHRQLRHVGPGTLDRGVAGQRAGLEQVPRSAERGPHDVVAPGDGLRAAQPRRHRWVPREVGIHHLLCPLDGRPGGPRESAGSHAVHQAEVEGLRGLALPRGDRIDGGTEHRGGRFDVQVGASPEHLGEGLVTRHRCQHPQLLLAVVGDGQDVVVSGDEAPSIDGVGRDLGEVRVAVGDPAGADHLANPGVDAAGRGMDRPGQPVATPSLHDLGGLTVGQEGGHRGVLGVVAQDRLPGGRHVDADPSERLGDLLGRVEVDRLRAEQRPGRVLGHHRSLRRIVQGGQLHLDGGDQVAPGVGVDADAAQLHGRQRGNGLELAPRHLDQATGDQLAGLLGEHVPGDAGVLGGVVDLRLGQPLAAEGRADRLLQPTVQAVRGDGLEAGPDRVGPGGVEQLLGQHGVGDPSNGQPRPPQHPQVERRVVEDLEAAGVGEHRPEDVDVDGADIDHEDGKAGIGGHLHRPEDVDPGIPAGGFGVHGEEGGMLGTGEPAVHVVGAGGQDHLIHGNHPAPAGVGPFDGSPAPQPRKDVVHR